MVNGNWNLQLFPDEKLVKELHPSRLSFIRIYLVGVIFIAWGIVFTALTVSSYWKKYMQPFFLSAASHLTVVFGTAAAGSYGLFWLTVTFLLALIALMLTRRHRHLITFGAFILLIVAAVLLFRTFSFLRAGPGYFFGGITLAAGIAAFVLADYYRKAYKYFITNFRIAMIRRFLTYNEVYVRYENLVDIDVHMSLLGRIFSFGNIIPITSAGLGLGVNLAGREGAGGNVSVRGTDIPRAIPSECFFGIKRPYTVRNDIAGFMQKSSSTYELKQIQQELSSRPR
jgi:hypothetical protein